MSRLRIAPVARGATTPELADWVAAHRTCLSRHALVATGTAGGTPTARLPDLAVERSGRGPSGGDLRIGARIADGALDIRVVSRDPLTARPHAPDLRALLRVAQAYAVPAACDAATASLLPRGLAGKGDA